MHILGGEKANTSFLWGRRGDRLYSSVNSYNIGEGRAIRVWFFHSCIPRPSLVLFVLSSLVTTILMSILAHGSFYSQGTTRGIGEGVLRMTKFKFSNEIEE